MDTRSLSVLAVVWLVAGSSIVQGARAVDAGDGWPVLGTAIVAAIAGVEVVVLLWLRQTPVPPGDDARYRITVLIKLSTAASIALGAFALAVLVGPWWLSVVGVALSIVGLVLAWPSPADRERHELLYLV